MSEPIPPMSTPSDGPVALSPPEVLRRARPLPPLTESVIEDLTENEERVFWETICSA